MDGRPKHVEICVDRALYLQPKKEDRKKEKKKKNRNCKSSSTTGFVLEMNSSQTPFIVLGYRNEFIMSTWRCKWGILTIYHPHYNNLKNSDTWCDYIKKKCVLNLHWTIVGRLFPLDMKTWLPLFWVENLWNKWKVNCNRFKRQGFKHSL